MSNVLTKITFHGLDRSPAVERRVETWLGKILHVAQDITRCDVVIDAPHRHHRHGRRFHVRIELDRPSGAVIVSHDRGSDAAHEDVHVAVRDAFLAARRQLEVRDGHAEPTT